MKAHIAPIVAVIPTRNRSQRLMATLRSLAEQSLQPRKVVIIDASDEYMESVAPPGLFSEFVVQKATTRGAASQRVEAMRHADEPYVLFMDDDIDLEPKCIERLYQAIEEDQALGAVNACITNQYFIPPGFSTRAILWVLGNRRKYLQGRVLFGSVNFLPGKSESAKVETDWLNTGCTVYRKAAMPTPIFPPFFTGYSLCEDLYISRMIARKWKLANVPLARIYHDSQPGDHKNDLGVVSAQAVRNRAFVLVTTNDRPRRMDFLRMLVWEMYSGLAASMISDDKLAIVGGKLSGVRQAWDVWKHRHQLSLYD